jgi:hypothetical protein
MQQQWIAAVRKVQFAEGLIQKLLALHRDKTLQLHTHAVKHIQRSWRLTLQHNAYQQHADCLRHILECTHKWVKWKRLARQIVISVRRLQRFCRKVLHDKSRLYMQKHRGILLLSFFQAIVFLYVIVVICLYHLSLSFVLVCAFLQGYCCSGKGCGMTWNKST